MPGVIGYLKPLKRDEGLHFIDAMANALENESHFYTKTYVEDGFGYGAIELVELNDHHSIVWNDKNNIGFIFYGEIYNRLDLVKKLEDKNIFLEKVTDENILLNLYLVYGEQFASLLNAACLILIWHVDTKTIKIINDRMGLHPLYYAQIGKQFLFSSGIRALLVDHNISRSVDLTAISEIFTFDHILGQRTMLSNIKLMPQGSILTFSNGELTIKPYHFFQLTQQHPLRSVDSYIEEYMMHMKKAIQRQYHGESGIGLMLSGGLDSRFILALMADISKQPLHTFSWSIPGSDDARFAKEAAKKAGTIHHFFELPSDWILEKGEKAIRLTDGNANIINLHAFANIEQESQITNTIFKGFLGDAMMGFGVRPRFWADYDEHTLMEVHLEAYRDYRVLTFDTPDHASVFTDSFYENTRESLLNDFKTGMLASKAKQMTDQRIYFDLTQRVPRMTINGVEVSRHRAQIRLPFADNDLLDFSLTLPPWLRLSRTLMNQAFIRYYPEYAKIPIAQTGLPMISCARELMLRNWQFIQWHLRNKGLHRLAGPKNRPYKDYTNWFRTNLRTWVENILLNERHLNRGYLKPQVIKNLVSEHMAGANHTSKLGAMLSVEIWHQQNID
ncbi:MAG: hypothetical protein CL609_20305 [Anaerolineaceae bacterium]|nr:hypothetical protein [Anaerolineaceae bacterium]